MNLYDLYETKNNSTCTFNNPLYEKFDNTQNLLDNQIDDIDNINIPIAKSFATDNNYQCSDEYNIKGNTINNTFDNLIQNIIDCKNNCMSDNDCIGFNYDNAKKKCILKKNVSSFTNTPPNTTLCIKKSPIDTDLKIDINTANITDTTNTKYPLKIPSIVNTIEIQNDTLTQPEIQQSTQPEIQQSTQPEIQQSTQPETNNINNEPIYVDMNCFMKNIKSLQNHTDNMMIDLSLLMTNIKTCSYVKKPQTSQSVQLTSIETETVNKNINLPIQSTMNNTIESFTNSKQSIFPIFGIKYQNLILIIILIILIYLLVKNYESS